MKNIRIVPATLCINSIIMLFSVQMIFLHAYIKSIVDYNRIFNIIFQFFTRSKLQVQITIVPFVQNIYNNPNNKPPPCKCINNNPITYSCINKPQKTKLNVLKPKCLHQKWVPMRENEIIKDRNCYTCSRCSR
jgi:hypothetical protein